MSKANDSAFMAKANIHVTQHPQFMFVNAVIITCNLLVESASEKHYI